jgi:hypothetical protein
MNHNTFDTGPYRATVTRADGVTTVTITRKTLTPGELVPHAVRAFAVSERDKIESWIEEQTRTH